MRGWIEYFDDTVAREGHPNLFIYKHQIRTISEAVEAADRAKSSWLKSTKIGHSCNSAGPVDSDVKFSDAVAAPPGMAWRYIDRGQSA